MCASTFANVFVQCTGVGLPVYVTYAHVFGCIGMFTWACCCPPRASFRLNITLTSKHYEL